MREARLVTITTLLRGMASAGTDFLAAGSQLLVTILQLRNGRVMGLRVWELWVQEIIVIISRHWLVVLVLRICRAEPWSSVDFIEGTAFILKNFGAVSVLCVLCRYTCEELNIQLAS